VHCSPFGGGRLRATWRRDPAGRQDAPRWQAPPQDRLARPAPAPPRPAVIQVTAVHPGLPTCPGSRWLTRASDQARRSSRSS